MASDPPVPLFDLPIIAVMCVIVTGKHVSMGYWLVTNRCSECDACRSHEIGKRLFTKVMPTPGGVHDDPDRIKRKDTKRRDFGSIALELTASPLDRNVPKDVEKASDFKPTLLTAVS